MDFVRGTKVTDLSPLARIDLDGRGAGRGPLQGLPRPDPGGRLLPRRSASREPPDHRRRPAGPARPRHGGAGRPADAGAAPEAPPRRHRRPRGRRPPRSRSRLAPASEDFDEARYRREVADLVGSYQDVPAEQMQVGRVVHRPRPPGGRERRPPAPELTMMGKALLHLDEIARARSTPTSIPTRSCAQHSDSIMRRHMLKKLSPATSSPRPWSSRSFVQQLPGADELRARQPGRQQARSSRSTPSTSPA